MPDDFRIWTPSWTDWLAGLAGGLAQMASISSEIFLAAGNC